MSRHRHGHLTFKLHGRKGHYYWNLLYTGNDGVSLMVSTGVQTYTTMAKARAHIGKIKELAGTAHIEEVQFINLEN